MPNQNQTERERFGPNEPRYIAVGDVFRYSTDRRHDQPVVDRMRNYHWFTSPSFADYPALQLEKGISAPSVVDAPGGRRRPVVVLRSSSHKAGTETTPWRDQIDMEMGRARYFGDHKPDTVGRLLSTTGNKLLADEASPHLSPHQADRRLATPIFLFQGVSVRRGGKTIPKGHVQFCGLAVMTELEEIVAADPATGRQYPNLAAELRLITSFSDELIDLRWIDDRRNELLSVEVTNRFAPDCWLKWVDGSVT